MSEYQKAVDRAVHILDELETAIEKSTAPYGELRKRADDVYQSRVEQIARERGVDMSKAHGLASKDDVARRAYAVSQELAERHDEAITGANQVTAYIE